MHVHVDKACLEDLEWNHMDGLHRPFIHGTQKRAELLLLDKEVKVIRDGWLTVFDVRLEPGRFCQIVTLGPVSITSLIAMEPVAEGTRQTVSWTIRPRWLRPILEPMVRRLNERQNREDAPIRARRTKLRAAGYTFGEVNYLTANDHEKHVCEPS